MDLKHMKEKRKELELTQMDLAVKVGVSLMTIQLWERGITAPNPENKEKLYKALEIGGAEND